MINTEYFEFVFSELDKTDAKEYADCADVFVNDFCGALKLLSKLEKITVYICESVDKYLELTDKKRDDYEEWMVGNSDYIKSKICIISSRISTTHSKSELKKVFLHETVHVILDRLFGSGDTPLWVAEGIAILFAEQTETEYLDNTHYPKVSDLCRDGFYDCEGYMYSGVYVWYFIELYGADKFIQLYNNETELSLPPDFEISAIKNYVKKFA